MRTKSNELHSRIIKRNIVQLNRRLDIEISEEIDPLIEELLNIGLLREHEIIQLKGLMDN